jgi:putative peptidoglycan lipid II flippase
MTETRIFKNARLISTATLLSRVLGLVRDVLCASLFGAGLVWDAFALAFLVPNLFRRLFGEGALSAAMIPVFTERLEKEGTAAASALASRVLTTFGAVLAGFVLIGWIGAWQLETLLGWFNVPYGEKAELVRRLLMILMPYLLLICLVALMGGVLNAMRHFAAPAFLPVLLNLAWIGALAIAYGTLGGDPGGAGVTMIAWVIVGVGLAQVLLEWWLLRRKDIRITIKPQPRHRDVREVAALFFPMVLGLAIFQINVLADNLIAEAFVPGDGAVSYLYYGGRVMQLPLALIGISIATAVFPEFSRQTAADAIDELRTTLQRSIRACIVVGVPASAGLILVGPGLINLLFGYRNFGAVDAARTGTVLQFYAIGIWALSINHILTRAFYSLKDTKTPVRIGAWMLVFNVGLNFALVHPLGEAGLALSTAVTGILNLALLSWVLGHRVGGLDWPAIRTTLTRTVGATVLMGGAVFGWMILTDGWFASGSEGSLTGRLVSVGGSVVVGVIVFGAAGLGVFKVDRKLLRF